MSVLVLLITFLMLITNLKSYKNLFKSNKEYQREWEGILEKNKDNGKEAFVVAVFILLLISISFYVITAHTFESSILIIYSVLRILGSISTTIKGINSLETGKNMKVTLLHRILVPVNTVFIVYFLYVYMN